MRKISLIVIGLLTLPVESDLFALHTGRQSRPSSEVGVIRNRSTGAEYQAGVVLVKLKLAGGALGKRTTGDASLDAALEPYGLREVRQLFPRHRPPEQPGGVDLSRFVAVEYTSPLDPSSLSKELNKHPAVEYAEPKYISRIEGVPNDSLYSSQYHLPVIKAAEAWDITQGSSSVIIAIVDTGTDWNHPDLKDNIWVNPGEIPGNGVDDDNNGFVDDVVGWDFSGVDFRSPDNDPKPGPSHGTHVAGIASAVTDNGVGIAGVGFRCRLMVVKTTRDAPDEERILFGYEGMVYAADNGADVINCSWGSNASSMFQRDVVQYATDKGSLVVGAAGNENSDDDHFPSGYPHVLSVAWVNQGDTKSFFSNFGPGVDVSAPGSSILSTFPNGLYGTLSGTSMSSPVAAGVGALVKTLHPGWTPDQVGEQVRVSSDPIDGLNPSYVRQLGFGRVNALRALTVISPSVRLTGFSLSDAAFGDGDGVLEPGERVQVVAEFTNYLESTTNTSVELTTSSSLVTIQNALATLGAIGTLETSTNAANPFLFTISSSAPENSSVLFTLLINDGVYQDYSSFRVHLNPTYLNHDVNNIVMTVTSKGTLAFDDFPSNALGDGFLFRRGINLLFEGAFMAAISSGQVVDVSRDDSGIAQSGDFRALDKVSVVSPGSASDQETFSLFSDEQTGSNRVGLTVALRTYAFRNTPDNDYIILRYAIHNTSGSSISPLYTGLYFDWDLGSALRNSARYDPQEHLGSVEDLDPGGIPTNVGVTILSHPALEVFRAISNPSEDPEEWGVYDGFTKQEKWEALSSGVSVTSVDTTDASYVIGVGPLSVASGDSVIVSYAVLAGDDLTSLRSSAGAARAKWAELSQGGSPGPSVPTAYRLYQNYPNPFNPSTIVEYDIHRESIVRLSLYNVLGERVAVLVDGRQPAGRYRLNLNRAALGSSLSGSGVYFYRLETSAADGSAEVFEETKKMVLIK